MLSTIFPGASVHVLIQDPCGRSANIDEDAREDMPTETFSTFSAKWSMSLPISWERPSILSSR